ncbi:unnamed protein product [Soboliphyme baturini]|uniref:SCP domain-containing protein n=1 Tax=Soboliphyme baturini TaxID=241478 RepID=A0A183IW24_9BILA|nr:unnamed protein product [Soboliphyme baturini]
MRESVRNIANDFRALVAQGRAGETTPPGKYPVRQPPAKNMKILAWNNTLEQLAVDLARSCEFEHDTRKKEPYYGKFGQNLAFESAPLDTVYTKDVVLKLVKSMSQSWFDEHYDFRYGPLPSGVMMSYLHYTQVNNSQ